MTPKWCLRLVLALAWLLVATAITAQAEVVCFVSIAPQQYIVQQIGKDLVEVHVMVQPGASPATYEPKPRQMVALAASDLYFSIGVPFEKVWMPNITAANPRMRVVATDQGIEKQPMADHHAEAADPDHQGGGLDPHIWTSPPLVLRQSRTVLAALQETDPVHREAYAANHAALESEIDALDKELREMFAGLQGARFLVFHPSWGYFAKTYGLVQEAIEIEGKAPKPAQLTDLIRLARKSKIDAIFVQPQFSRKSAELIANAIGAKIIAADPLAADWAANLRRQAAQFAAAAR